MIRMTRVLIVLGVLALAACGGTALEYAGPLCGSSVPATLTLADQKDRSAFDASCRQTYYRQDGTVARVDEVTISSSESSASAVIAAQADALGKLAAAVAAAK
jgi:hypothetical protein